MRSGRPPAGSFAPCPCLAILFLLGLGIQLPPLAARGRCCPAAAHRSLTVDMLQVRLCRRERAGGAAAAVDRGRSGQFALDRAGTASEPMNVALRSLQRAPLETPSRAEVLAGAHAVLQMVRCHGHDQSVRPRDRSCFPDLLPFERPFVLAHEWAHLAGHADEAEASAVAGWPA